MATKRNGMAESEAGKLGFLASKKTMERQYNERIEKYYENPNYCKNCGKILEYNKKHNSFCSSSCAAIYNNVNRSKDVYEKQKETLFNTLLKKYGDKKHVVKEKRIKKRKVCKQCGCYIGECLHPEICKKHRIFKSLAKFGFDLSTIGTLKVYDEFNRVKKILEEEYKHHIDDTELKEKYGYISGIANFHKILRTLGIKKRTIKESLKESYLLGKINIKTSIQKYVSEWHKTWDGREVFLRSSYEIDYANELDKNKIVYDVEDLRIKYFDSVKQEYRCAVPDFHLIDTNELVEIKSDWTLDKQNMKDKFKEYIKLGYKPRLILEHKEVNIDDM